MSDDQLEQAMQSWLHLRDVRLEPKPGPALSHADQLGLVQRALAIAQPWLRPPQTGLIGETARIVQQWQASWTTELRSSPHWMAAKVRLKSLRQQIVSGELLDADWGIRDIFIRCVPSSRRLTPLYGPARVAPQTASANKPEIDSDEVAKALDNLVDWLERL